MNSDFRLWWTFFKLCKLVSRSAQSQSWPCPFNSYNNILRQVSKKTQRTSENNLYWLRSVYILGTVIAHDGVGLFPGWFLYLIACLPEVLTTKNYWFIIVNSWRSFYSWVKYILHCLNVFSKQSVKTFSNAPNVFSK